MKDVTKILCTMAVMSGLINMGLKALRQGYNNLFCDANEDFDVRDYIESFVEGLVGGALLGTLAITIAFMANMQLLTMYAMLLGVSVVMGVIQIAIATYNSDELGVAISAVFLLLSVFAVSKLWGLKQKTVVNKTDGKAKVIEVEDGTVKTKTEPCIDEGTPVAGEEGNSGNVGGRKTGTYKELRKAGYKDAHHIIQDAAVKDIEGYNKGSAPAIQLEGPSNQVGTEHYNATKVQRQGGGGTYGQERGIAYKALRKAGFSIEESKAYVRYADKYFMGELGLTLDSPTRIPGNRKGH